MGKALISVLLKALAAVENVGRGTWTVLVGLLFLTLGFSFNWFSPPSSRLSSFDAGALNIVTFEPEEAILLRLLVLVVAAFLLFGLLRGERQRFAVRAGVWMLLAATLAFPYAINLWEPEIAIDSASAWNRLDDTITGEMDNSYNAQQTVWRRDQTLAPLGRNRLLLLAKPLSGIVPVAPGGGGGQAPNGSFGRAGSLLSDGLDPTIFRFARQADVVSQLLGVSNAFLNLAGRGWFGSLIGSIVVIIGLYLPEHRGSRSFCRDMRFVLPCYTILCLGLLTPRVVAEVLVSQGENAIARGDGPAAEYDLRAAAIWRPILKYALVFQARLGDLALARNCFDCADSLLSLAYTAMEQYRLNDAIALLQRYHALNPASAESRYWLGFAYGQEAISLYNIGQDSAAAEDWWKSLSYFSLGADALYGLELTQFHMRNFDAAARLTEQIVDIQHLFFWKRPPPTSQWHLAQAWAAYAHGNIAQAHAYYSLSVTPENW